jgi:hypothetical protein
MHRSFGILRIVAWTLLITFVPLILLAFIVTHFVALLWLALIGGIAASIYWAVASRRTQ